MNIQGFLFLDIETVPQFATYDQLSEEMKDFWSHKAGFLKKEEGQTTEDIYDRAGIYAEFGKIICISVGMQVFKDGAYVFRVKSFYGHDEKSILHEFAQMANKLPLNTSLVGHNIKEFDIPYLCRRMLIQGIPIPTSINFTGKKPWEVNVQDTLDLWKFGDYKHFSSLKLLTHILGVPSPKDDIDGSQVAEVYYSEGDAGLERIREYCQKDVVAVARLFQRMRSETFFEDQQIEIA